RASERDLGATGDAADPVDAAVLDKVADELWKHRGESLVVTGCNDVATQLVVHTINRLLDNLGKTVDIDRPSLQRQGDDAAMAELVAEMQRGEIHALIMHGVNPGYDYLDGEAFVKALSKVALSVSTADRVDETSAAVHAVCPDHHFLESWGDAEPVTGYLSSTQQTIAPLFDTRAVAETLLRWIDDGTDAYGHLRGFWKAQILPRQNKLAEFDAFWDHTLERGVLELGAPAAAAPAAAAGDWRA